jgi:hypothetical protein
MRRLLLLLLLAVGLSGCSDSGGGGDGGGEEEPTEDGTDEPTPGDYSLTVDGDVQVLCPYCLTYGMEATPANPCASLNAPDPSANGIDCHYTAIPAEAAGLGITFTSGDGFIDAIFTDACAPDAAVLAFVNDAGTPYKAEIPAGTACVIVFEYGDLVPKTFSFTIE